MDQKPWWNLDTEATKALKNALDLQEKLYRRLSDPCLTGEEKKEIDKMARSHDKTIENILNIQKDIHQNIIWGTANKEYLPHVQ